MAGEDENKVEKPSFDMVKLVPTPILEKYNKGAYKTEEEAIADLNNHYQSIAKNNGYGLVKETQIGTHNSIKNNLKQAAADAGEPIELPETAETKDYINALSTKIKTLKEAMSSIAKKDLTEEAKQALKDLEQTKAALEKSKQEEAKLLKLIGDKEVEGNIKLENAVKGFHTQKLLDEALSKTASSRIPTIGAKTIRTMFKEDYEIDVQLENGEAKGYVIRDKTGKQAEKKANEFFSNIEDVLLHIYKQEGYLVNQPAQKESTGAQGKQGEGEKPANPLFSTISVPKGV